MLTSIIIRKILAGILSIMLSFGVITPISTETPITFKNADETKLSFVAVSDIHMLDNSFDSYYFNRIFEDVENSQEKMDGIVLCGDLADNGLSDEYDALFEQLDNETAIPYKIVASGNHDMRYEFKKNSKIIQGKVEEYLGIDTNGKNYYSYDINGYTFIVMGTEKQEFERAYISDEQLAFIDRELARATMDGKPAFVICHQPLANTHGLPEVWKTGDLGKQSEQVRAILTKYKNVFYINGHLHDGIYERTSEELADSVYSINLPTFRKENDFGEHSENGLGFYVEVYDNEVIFTARDFKRGKAIDEVFTYELAPVENTAFSKAEIIELFNKSADKIKTDATKVTRNYEDLRHDEQYTEMPPMLESLGKSLISKFLTKNETPVGYTEADITANYPVKGQPFVSKATVADVAKATCTDDGTNYNITLRFNESTDPAIGSGVASAFNVIADEEIYEAAGGLVSEASTRYYDAVITCKIDKATGNIIWANYKLPLVLDVTANIQTSAFEARIGMTFIDDYTIAY